ncbi:hypothetical protein SNE40_011974 [Patella caerulea]|uniref:Target of EGR1 protein 1 n=1 Tax=Patella caerulea TaxID=87958 RepID=A0AAN8JN10_PATCE
MALFGKPVKVPVIDVNTDNIKEIWPSLCLAIKSATYIGVDTELSGLGDRKLLNAKCIEDRYTSLLAVAKSRSILSLGISCFKIKPNPDEKSKSKWYYYVQTFNIMVLCSENYIVEPASLKFLVDHSFDFNRQYATGVPYYRGNDKDNFLHNSPSVRGIFSLIVYSQVPLVFHNALVDLVFLYQNFYADLPNNFTSFVADLSEMFPTGLIDTKYITDFLERFEASYLEYVFMQCQRENLNHLSEMRQEVSFEFPNYPDAYKAVGYHYSGFTPREWSEAEIEKLRSSICLCFAAHGWCSKPRTCPLLHDVDLVISIDYLLSAKQRRSRKRNRNRKLKGNKSLKCEDDLQEDNDSMKNSDTESEVSAEISCDKGDNRDFSAVKKSKMNANCGGKEEINKNGLENGSNISLVPNSIEHTVDKTNSESDKSGPCDSSDHYKKCDNIQNGRTEETKGGASHSNDSASNVARSASQTSLNAEGLSSSRSGGHRAGFDAFMTGAILSVFIAKNSKNMDTDLELLKLSDFNVNQFINKMYLSGKDMPLIITKSSFSKVSNNHKVKLEKLKFFGL